ncbi:hypothetical protein GCM10023340_04810 [Nocardioides marinquilinus]|uniref:Peptidase S8 n=1 Tax=Nocardioides marinquilinus TaxID=1210400 RepID=A0ABP9P7G1_9ACTN
MSPRRQRVLSIWALVLAVVAAVLAVATPPGSAAPAPDADKIKPQLAKQLDSKGEASFWIRFQQPDLSKAASIADWDERGRYVYETLSKAAEKSQGAATSLLESQGVDFHAYYATNAIRVSTGDADLVNTLAAQPAVVGLYPTSEYQIEKPTPGKDVKGPDALEWGVANINADDVWNQFGTRGEGLVIGNIDSGVQYDHPALVNQYRGNNGDGTFTHDYNWFDAAGECPDAPCDNDGHGTHTMGTMVGSDGGANQVGVAPGATWIAANGCCPSDEALISSGEWMLAPTDLEGNNADPSKRPNIINNSWGTQVPTNDPFMEDVLEAWEAAGIFGTWSNGNNGPACQTSGSPGSRTINYSVGAYDVNNGIADFSSRGVGQDGEIKPNISAPGVNVRSTLPGSTYGSYSGTSMAAPHLGGAIALLWSAAPGLVGDIEGTRALLDGSAVDTEDDQCGGTADDNNVFGEGRLDALALVTAAPTEDAGRLEGTVTDAESGEGIDGAAVTIAAGEDYSRTVTTDAEGDYGLALPAGDYTVTAAAFGYPTTTEDVTVVAQETTTQDFALTASDVVTVGGSVLDGSGHGWPLYAKLDVAGPGPDAWTDPATGEFSMTLPGDATYTVTVTAQYPGYETATREITVAGGDVVEEIELPVDDSTCTAPGYTFTTEGVTETFDGDTAPAGWTVTDEEGNGQVWTFDDPGDRGNLTGGEGGFAIVDSDEYGSGGAQDTSLVSPVIDMSDLSAPVVGFKQDYYNLGDTADVDVSIDGGETWETVLSQTSSVRGPDEKVVQLPMAAGQPEVQVRWHYYDAGYNWWWQVDDVFVGNRTCDPVRGGLVVGNVYGPTGRAGVNGATVTSLDKPDEKATTAPTPADPNLDDGFYWMFSSITGQHRFEATANQYGSQVKRLGVPNNWVVKGNFRLAAGQLSVTPAQLDATAVLGGAPKSKTFTVTNTGNRPVEVEFAERPGGFDLLSADGSRLTSDAIADADGAPLQRLKVPTSLGNVSKGGRSMGVTGTPTVKPNEAPWTDIADYPGVVMDNRVVTVDGVAYSIAGGDGTTSSAEVWAYDPATLTWAEKAPLPGARNAVAAGNVGGQIVVTGGWAEAGPSPATFVYDPATDAWSEGADAPVDLSASGQAVADGKLYVVGGCTTADCLPMSNAVAAYDPAADTWTELADYPDAVAFASCGGIDGMVYCTGGNDGNAGTAASYVYDPGADSWTALPDAPVDTWASQYAVGSGQLVVNGGVQGAAVSNRSFAYDPAAGAWADLPNSNTARYRGGMACGVHKIGGSSGGFTATVDSETLPGFDDCAAAAADVEWLSLNKTSATLAPGQSTTVRVTMDPNVAQPGTYTASVAISEDAPGSVEPVEVTMTVTPPSTWGKLVGTVSGRSCAGAVAPLAGATVAADSFAGEWTFSTGADGTFAYWFNAKVSPLTMIAAKDGYRPQSKSVRLYRGEEVRADFTLAKTGC